MSIQLDVSVFENKMLRQLSNKREVGCNTTIFEAFCDKLGKKHPYFFFTLKCDGY